MSRRTSKSTLLRSRWAGDAGQEDRDTIRNKVTKERRKLWDKLNAYVTNHGGSVISMP